MISTVRRPIVTVCTPTFQGPRTPGSLGTGKSELPQPTVVLLPGASSPGLVGPVDDASPGDVSSPGVVVEESSPDEIVPPGPPPLVGVPLESFPPEEDLVPT